MKKNSDKLGNNPARILKHTQWNFIEKAGLIKMNKSQYTQKTNDQQRETAEDPYIYIYICTERIRPGAKNETEARRRPHHSYMYKKNQKTQKKPRFHGSYVYKSDHQLLLWLLSFCFIKTPRNPWYLLLLQSFSLFFLVTRIDRSLIVLNIIISLHADTYQTHLQIFPYRFSLYGRMYLV